LQIAGSWLLKADCIGRIKVPFFAFSAERMGEGEEHLKAFLHACAARQPEGTDQKLFQKGSCEKRRGHVTGEGMRGNSIMNRTYFRTKILFWQGYSGGVKNRATEASFP